MHSLFNIKGFNQTHFAFLVFMFMLVHKFCNEFIHGLLICCGKRDEEDIRDMDVKENIASYF